MDTREMSPPQRTRLLWAGRGGGGGGGRGEDARTLLIYHCQQIDICMNNS